MGAGAPPYGRSVRIRRALEDESSLLTGIARAAKASWGYPEAWLHEWRDALTLTAEYVAAHTVLVAEAGGALVGMCALEVTAGDAGEAEGELAHLWVLPGWHGRGVGRALVERVFAAARRVGCRALRIESDPNAEAFYRRLGAVRVGRVDAPVAARARTLPVLRVELDPE